MPIEHAGAVEDNLEVGAAPVVDTEVAAAAATDFDVGERQRVGGRTVGDAVTLGGVVGLDVAAGDVRGVVRLDLHAAHIDVVTCGGRRAERTERRDANQK